MGPDLADSLQHAADYIGQILKGVNPADLPVKGSEKSLLTVNSKVAKDLGITVPAEVRARYGVAPHEILLEVGRRGYVGGQEDMIIDIAVGLAQERDLAATGAR